MVKERGRVGPAAPLPGLLDQHTPRRRLNRVRRTERPSKMLFGGGGAAMFCDGCAALTHTLTFDLLAEPRAELTSGSCMWADELHRDWCIQCIWKSREVFHLR